MVTIIITHQKQCESEGQLPPHWLKHQDQAREVSLRMECFPCGLNNCPPAGLAVQVGSK